MTDDELATIWQSTGTLRAPLGAFHRVLLLTGQRREEVAGMGWSELDRASATWIIPADRAKNGVGERDWREHAQAADWCGRLVADVLGLNIEEKSGKSKATAILREWIKSGALGIEERPDRNREPRKYVIMGDPA